MRTGAITYDFSIIQIHDGVDIRDMKRDDLRSFFGKDAWLFSGKIKDMVNHMQVTKKLSMLRKEPMCIT